MRRTVCRVNGRAGSPFPAVLKTQRDTKKEQNKMKKLMIAAAVALVGLSTFAAKANWTIDYSYQPGSTDYNEGWMSYFIDAGDCARDTFIASLSDNTYTDLIATYGGAASDVTDSEGYADGSAIRTDYGNPEDVTGYFVLFNSDDAATATLAYVSETMTEATGTTSGQSANFGFGDVTATQNAANWTAVGAIPEPTSGLLLLLGVAGLALRRRRA